MLTFILIAVTVLVSWQGFERPRLLDRLTLWPPAIQRHKQFERLLTYGFVHADWTHLLFNMITLYFFGRMMELVFTSILGAPGFFLVFYLSAIVVSILPTYLRHRRDPHYRSLGASGAVSAVMFAFILLQPWTLIYVFFLPMPAIIYAVVYIGYSIWMDRRGMDNINHSAHLSGAIYGVLFMLLMEPRFGQVFLQELASPSFG